MEYAVYLKQGISFSQIGNAQKLSNAYYQIVFEEVTLDFSSFTESFWIILRILSIGHELFSLSTFSKIITEGFYFEIYRRPLFFSESPIFETPIEIFIVFRLLGSMCPRSFDSAFTGFFEMF